MFSPVENILETPETILETPESTLKIAELISATSENISEIQKDSKFDISSLFIEFKFQAENQPETLNLKLFPQ